MIKIFLIWVIVAVAVCGSSTRADNAACWGDDSRVEITCIKITESLLLSLRGQNVEFVQKALDAKGKKVVGGLRFLSNFSRGASSGAGSINVTFEQDRVVVVMADVDIPGGAGHRSFVWNAFSMPILGTEFDRRTINYGRLPFCSDISAEYKTCRAQDLEGQLTLFQMQFLSTRADLADVLSAACALPGSGQSDCARVRRRLQ